MFGLHWTPPISWKSSGTGEGDREASAVLALLCVPRSGLGEGLMMIGRLLGHTQIQTTARYAHLANESVKATGSRVGDSIGAHIASAAPA